MGIFSSSALDGHEHVSYFTEPSVGLRAIIAIHRTGPLGIAGGGCRMWPYADEDEAARDALRLSRAMTYKMALFDLPAGGAKAIVWGDPARDKSEGLLRALGRAIDRLGGRFVVSEDVGTTPEDMAIVARETLWVNPHGLGRGLDGLRVAVQGLGHVGRQLAGLLGEAGALLVVSDLDRALVDEAVEALGGRGSPPEAIAAEEVEVFARSRGSAARWSPGARTPRSPTIASPTRWRRAGSSTRPTSPSAAGARSRPRSARAATRRSSGRGSGACHSCLT
jgi:leucine dehydrogenase